MSKLKFTPVNISRQTNAVYGKGVFKGKRLWFSYLEDGMRNWHTQQALKVDYRGVKERKGIPFKLTHDKSGRARLVLLGGRDLRDKGYKSKAKINLTGSCSRIIFATSVDFMTVAGLPHGDPQAMAVLTYADGSTANIPFCLFFETAPVCYRWGTEPFRAFRSNETEWVDPFGPKGFTETFGRMTNTATGGGALMEWLFPWVNPNPRKKLKSIEFESVGDWSFMLLGLTLQQGEGNPLQRKPKQKVLVEGPRGSTVEVKAERGQVFRERRTTGKRGAGWLKGKVRGRGGFNQKADGSKLHADIFVAPDEDVTVTVNRKGKGRDVNFKAADIDAGRALKKSGVTVRKLNVNERYINVRIVDENNRPVSTRVHFADQGGRYLAPAGHPEMPRHEWNVETGGDCWNNGTPYAYVSGEFQVRIPDGPLSVEIIKGFEYKILRKEVNPRGKNLTLKLSRAFNEKKKGFYTADTHVHFLSPTSAVLESEAEDVDVTNILASQWGDLYTNTWDYTGGLSQVSTKDNLVWVGQENRQHSLGHSSLLGLREPIYPFCTGDPDEAELGAELECVIGEWLEKTQSQGGLAVIPHFPYPICENASLIMDDLVDGVELSYSMRHEPQALYGYYYRFLNLGQRVPVVGGTDKMGNGCILGNCRTFALVGKSGALTYERWADAVRRGKTYSSLGPVLSFEVDGRTMGDTITLKKGGGTLEIRGTASSVFPFGYAEVVKNGRAVEKVKAVFSNGIWKASIKTRVKTDGACWLALRAGSGRGLQQGTAAHSSPVYVKVKGTAVFDHNAFAYVTGLVNGAEYTIREKAALSANADLKYLLRYIDKAKDVLHHKLHHDTQDHGHK